MKYRFLALIGLLALSAGAVMQAQDYDDIYYDASKSASTTTKVVKQSKTVSAYGEVPDRYKAVAQGNYRIERDEDEYNRRGAFEPSFEVDINGDTIYLDSTYVDDEAFANTRRIERFYNPDIVVLSDDDDLVELYYDESPTINLIVGSDMGYAGSYGWESPYYAWGSSYYPWYTGWYPYYRPYYRPYYSYWYTGWYDYWSPWYSPYYYWTGPSLWAWNYWSYRPWMYNGYWGMGYPGGRPGHHYTDHTPARPHSTHMGSRDNRGRVGLASNRNPNGRVEYPGTNRNKGISTPTGTSRSSGSSVRGGYATNRGGNIGVNSSRGATTRSSGSVSRPSSVGTRGSSSPGGSRSPSVSGSSSRGSSGGSFSGGSSGGGSRGSSGGGGGSSSGSGRRH